MQTYIALLRGINVSGYKKIVMTELKKLFEEMGFADVKTYIQSGNVLFKTKQQKEETLETAIADRIKQTYEYEVTVMVKTTEDLEQIIAAIPFEDHEAMDPKKLAVAFCDRAPDADKAKAISNNYLPDVFTVDNKQVYIYCPNGFADTKLTNTFFEQKLKCRATTRNWNTTNKLLSLAKEL